MPPRSRTNRCSSAEYPTARMSQRRTTAPTVGFSARPSRTSRAAATTSVVVWNLASPQRPVLQFDVPGLDHQVALSPDGSQLYVGYWDPPAVTVYDVATGRKLRSASVPAESLEISPDGSLLAAADGNDLVIIDAATLTERRRLRGHSGGLQVIRFSPSGALLASGSDDRTAIVWDVTTGERRELLSGHDASVSGVDFSPDGDTLYTAAGRTMLTWDLTGQRRFIARRPLPERGRHDWATASPTGDAVAYMGTHTRVAVRRARDRPNRTPRRHRPWLLGLVLVAVGRATLRHRRRRRVRPDLGLAHRTDDHRAPRRADSHLGGGLHRRRPATRHRRTDRQDVHHRRRHAGTRRHAGPARGADRQRVRQPGQPHRCRPHNGSLLGGRPRQRPGAAGRRCPRRVHRRLLS